MGWERKRGKLEELNRLLRGATDTSYDVQVGELGVLPRVRYCLTLDSDTRLPRDGVKKLVGVIAHPLNRPRFDPRCGRVTEGYGILQPRVSVTTASAAGSRFAQIFAGHTGVDPYTTAVSDTYQDLFGEGSFTGQGALRRRRLHGGARRARPGQHPPLARSLRGAPRPHRARDRRRGGGRLPLERPRPRAAPAPLDARRLADPRLAPAARADARGPRAEPPPPHLALEDLRQPAARAARARDGRSCSSSPGRSLPGSPAVWTAAVVASLALPALPARARGARRPEAAPAAAGLPARARGGRAGDRGARPAAARLPREPGLRHGARDPRHARPRSPSRGAACSSGRPPPRAPRAAPGSSAGRARGRSSSRWRRAPRSRSPASSSSPRGARARSPRRRPCSRCGRSRRSSRTGSPSRSRERDLALGPEDRRLPPRRRPHDLEVLRGLHGPGGSLPARGQLPGGARADRAPDLAHQHRHGAPLDARGPRPRHHPDRRARRADRLHPHHDGGARAARGAPLQLVRHGEPRAAPAPLRLDGGQRQPRRRAHRGVRGAPPARARAGPARGGPADPCRAAREPVPARRRVRRRDELPLPLRRAAEPPRDRLPRRRRGGAGPARSLPLRPPRLGGAPRELHRDREGRPPREALVPPRPRRHERAREPGAPVVERDAVRVPHAAARDAQLPRHAARRDLPDGGAPAAGLRGGARGAVGDLGVRLRPRRSPRHLPVQGVRRPGARHEARASPTSWWSRRTRPRSPTLVHPDRGGGEPPPPRARRARRRVRLLRRDRLHAAAPGGARGGRARARPRPRARSCGRTSPTTRG